MLPKSHELAKTVSRLFFLPNLFDKIVLTMDMLQIILPYSGNIFVQKMLSAYYACCIFSNALQSNFIMEANTTNSDQTAPKGAV